MQVIKCIMIYVLILIIRQRILITSNNSINPITHKSCTLSISQIGVHKCVCIHKKLLLYIIIVRKVKFTTVFTHDVNLNAHEFFFTYNVQR